MFGVNNLWGTGKNQDILNDSLFGTVNLISYKNIEFSSKKEENITNDVKELKRKSRENECEFKTKNKKKKKNTGIINEGCVEGNCNSNKNNSNDLPEGDISENRHVNKKSKKKRKMNSKNIYNIASNQQNNIFENKVLDEIYSSIQMEENDNEILIPKATESDMNHENSKVGKKRKKQKQKGTAENLNKIIKSEDQEDMKIIPTIDNSKGNRQITENTVMDTSECMHHKKSKVKERRKKRKRNRTAENSDKIAICEIQDNMYIPPSNDCEGNQNSNSKQNFQIHMEVNNNEMHMINTLENDMNHEKLKVKKKRKKQKMNGTAENSDKFAISEIQDNMNIPSSNGCEGNQNSNSKENCEIHMEVDSNELHMINTLENDRNHEKLKVKKKRKKGKGKGAAENSGKVAKSDIQGSTKISPSNDLETKHSINSKENSLLIEPTDIDNKFRGIDTQVPSSNNLKWQQSTKYNKFQKKIAEKLKGGQFRWINEKLYSCKSCDAVDMFSSDPKLFDIYHNGFHSQVQQWPQNPVDVIIEYIKARDVKLVVADFGCGDAKISKSVPNKVHSFDLVAINEHVTACDMKNVPLSSNSIDVVVFCLSLMGTNLVDFLLEAQRVMKSEGILKIAEVKSRFEDIDKFIEDVCSLGFSLIQKDESNKMFVLMEFQNTGEIPSKVTANISLKPCIYKRR